MALLVGDTTPSVQYTATASQTTFAYPFEIFEDEDIKVYQVASGGTPNDTTDLLTLTTHYTVTNAGVTGGGDIVLVTGATVGDVITVKRDLAVKRTTDYQNLGDLASESFNDDLDKLVMMVQQNEEAFGRSISLQESTQTPTTFDIDDPTAEYYAAAKADLSGIKWVQLVSSGNLTVTPFIETVLDDSTAAEARTTLDAQQLDADTTKNDVANTFTQPQTFDGASPLVFEGATADAFETTLAIADPTADNTQTVQDKTGTLILNDDVSKIESITATVAASALTVGLNPTFLNFRSSTLTDGAPVSRTVSSAISMVIPSTATLESVNAIQTRIYLLAIDNAGTVELAVVNAAGGVNLNEEGLISTTAVGTGSDSNDVIYSTTARTSVAYRVVGMVEYTQATAGTYATAPSLIQGMGGNALTDMSSLGYGQTYQDVGGSRSAATTYYNTTGKPILVIVQGGNASTITPTVNGVALPDLTMSSANVYPTAVVIVPPNGSYSFVISVTFIKWVELR